MITLVHILTFAGDSEVKVHIYTVLQCDSSRARDHYL